MSYKDDLAAEFRSVGNKLCVYERFVRDGKGMTRIVITGCGYAPATKPAFFEYEDDVEGSMTPEQVSWNFAVDFEAAESEKRRIKREKTLAAIAKYTKKQQP